VTAGLETPTLEAWLRGGSARIKIQARYLVLGAAKRVLGDRTYQRIRQGLLGKANP
jgi:hypothetical protein